MSKCSLHHSSVGTMQLRFWAAFAAALAACAPAQVPARNKPAFAGLASARSAVAVYDGVVRIDPATREVNARWRIAFVYYGAGVDTIRLLLNDGFTISSVMGPSVAGFAVSKAEDHSLVDVVLRQGHNASDSIFIAYGGRLQVPDDSINNISSSWVELGVDSFWQPIFADFTHAIVGRTQVTLGHAFRLATSGLVAQSNDSTFMINMNVPSLDIAFTASPSLSFTERAGTRVYFTGMSTPLVARLLTTTEACSSFLNARFGQTTPLPPRRIVLAPRVGPGYARKNYIVVTQLPDTASVAIGRFVCHELAHFWSSRANPMSQDNWLNEGFAEYVSGQFVRSIEGETAYDRIVAEWREKSSGQGPVWTRHSTRRPPEAISYRKAPYLLTQLEARVGADRMRAIVRRYTTDPIPIGSTLELLAVIREAAGAQTSEWFEDLLSR